MPIQVLYFAGSADITKLNKEEWEIPLETPYAIDDLLKKLVEKYGRGFEKILGTCMFAVNMEYVSASHILQADDELAIIPPVSGG